MSFNTSFLITGATGFLGKHLVQYFTQNQYAFTTLGQLATNQIVCNLSTNIPKISSTCHAVIHAAGKAHIVPKTEEEKKEFYQVNLQGTKNLCKGLEQMANRPKAFVFISTVAVYGVDAGENINEQQPLSGNTPYAKSKIEAELFLEDWCKKNDVVLTILRLPLIAGQHPPGNLGAMIQGIKTGKYFNIAGGKAKKSMVMAADVAAFIPMVLAVGGTYHLTDGYHPSFAQLANCMATQLGKSKPKNMPLFLAKLMALFGDLLGQKAPINSQKLQKITATLTFSNAKAINTCNWQPQRVLDAFII